MATLSTALEFASATDPGRVRSHNEDSIGTDPEIGLAVLADGMGGYNAGEVASGIAVAVVSSETKRVLPGKSLIDELLRVRAQQLGDRFTLKGFFDEVNGAGMMPVSLIRWQLTGER